MCQHLTAIHSYGAKTELLSKTQSFEQTVNLYLTLTYSVLIMHGNYTKRTLHTANIFQTEFLGSQNAYIDIKGSQFDFTCNNYLVKQNQKCY